MSKLDTEAQVIEGVSFYYTKIQNPTPKFNPEDGNEFVEKFGEANAIGKGKLYFI